jgi:hypothetical protein
MGDRNGLSPLTRLRVRVDLRAMMLSESIDAAFDTASSKAARPFRIELRPEEIDALRDAGLLGATPENGPTASGTYRGVNIYPAARESVLLAQPGDDLHALRLPFEARPA